jgi:hypothetical protein
MIKRQQKDNYLSPRCFGASFNRQCWHKFRIFYMLTLYQWLPLSQKDFPKFVNPKEELFTLTKNETAIRLQFGTVTNQIDTPIHVFRIHYDPHNQGITNLVPVFNATPKLFRFSNNYTTLYSKVHKIRSEINICLETGTLTVLVRPTNYESFPYMRDQVAKFAKQYDRLPCYTDLVKLVPGCTQSVNLRNAIQAGFLKKVKYQEPDPRWENDPSFPFRFKTRVLYMPLYPEKHPDQEVDNYERYGGINHNVDDQWNRKGKGKTKAIKTEFEELTKL